MKKLALVALLVLTAFSDIKRAEKPTSLFKDRETSNWCFEVGPDYNTGLAPCHNQRLPKVKHHPWFPSA
jgi:hypothetical protein